MEQYQLDRLAAKLKIVHLLLGKADERGLTHGEKHHFIHVARHLLGEIYADVKPQSVYVIDEAPFDPDEADPIPF